MFAIIENNMIWFLVCSLLLVAVVGCSEPPRQSEEANDLALALYTTSRNKNAEGMELLRQKTEAALQEAKITEKEADVIQGLIAMAADQGEWDEAARLAREFLDSQVRGR